MFFWDFENNNNNNNSLVKLVGLFVLFCWKP